MLCCGKVSQNYRLKNNINKHKPKSEVAENVNKSKPLLCEVFDFLGLQFNVTQYKWGRKLYGGIWYHINPKGLTMGTFWSRNEIKSCQSETICFEVW